MSGLLNLSNIPYVPSASALLKSSTLTPQVADGSRANVVNELSQASPVSVAVGDENTEIRSDDHLHRLMKAGYVPLYRVYTDDVPTHLMSKTLLGDVIFIQIDDPEYQASFPREQTLNGVSDLDIQYVGNSTVIPEDVAMGSAECINYPICGAAFKCNDQVCFLERPSVDYRVNFEKGTYLIKGGHTVNAGAFDDMNNVLLYLPIVKMSSIFNEPDMLAKISTASRGLRGNAYEKLSMYQNKLNEQIKLLIEQSNGLNRYIATLHRQGFSDIPALENLYFTGTKKNRELAILLQNLNMKKQQEYDGLYGVSNIFSSSEDLIALNTIMNESITPQMIAPLVYTTGNVVDPPLQL